MFLTASTSKVGPGNDNGMGDEELVNEVAGRNFGSYSSTSPEPSQALGPCHLFGRLEAGCRRTSRIDRAVSRSGIWSEIISLERKSRRTNLTAGDMLIE